MSGGYPAGVGGKRHENIRRDEGLASGAGEAHRIPVVVNREIGAREEEEPGLAMQTFSGFEMQMLRSNRQRCPQRFASA